MDGTKGHDWLSNPPWSLPPPLRQLAYLWIFLGIAVAIGIFGLFTVFSFESGTLFPLLLAGLLSSVLIDGLVQLLKDRP